MEGYQCVGMDLTVKGWTVSVEVSDINREADSFDYCIDGINGHGIVVHPGQSGVADLKDLNSASFNIELENQIRSALYRSNKLG